MKDFFFYIQFLNFIRNLGKLFDHFRSPKLPIRPKEDIKDPTNLDVLYVNKTIVYLQVKGYPPYRPTKEEQHLPLAYLKNKEQHVFIRGTRKSNFIESEILVCVTYISTGKKDTILIKPDAISYINLDN